METLSAYEIEAWRQIQQWKQRDSGWLGSALAVVKKPLAAAGDLVFDNAVGHAFTKAFEGLISLINDAASWTVRTESVWAEFKDDGHHHVSAHADVLKLDLEDVDKVVGYLGAKYKSLAAAEGAAVGLVGAAGMIVDIPALIGLNLRAIGEYACYYGISLESEQERQYAMNVLMLGTDPGMAAKQATLANLNRIALDVAKRKSWKELERSVIVRGMQELAKALGLRLTKAKLAQVVPVAGAVVGGGYNAHYTSKVVEAASFMYRERFLMQKYGPEVLEMLR